MKLPSSVGQKKIKAIEQILMDQGVGECERRYQAANILKFKDWNSPLEHIQY